MSSLSDLVHITFIPFLDLLLQILIVPIDVKYNLGLNIIIGMKMKNEVWKQFSLTQRYTSIAIAKNKKWNMCIIYTIQCIMYQQRSTIGLPKKLHIYNFVLESKSKKETLSTSWLPPLYPVSIILSRCWNVLDSGTWMEVHLSPLASQRIRVSESGFCKPFHPSLCWPAKLDDDARLLTPQQVLNVFIKF